MRRKLLTLCVAACLLWLGCFSAVAAECDPARIGSISVTLTAKNENEPIVGATLRVYHVATAVQDADGRVIYDYTEDFERMDVALDDASLATALDAFVTQHGVPSAQMTTNAEGTARCSGLPLGLYFVRQTGAVEGFAPCTPFVVTVPAATADGLVYDVNASPKTEVTKLTSVTIKKVWNTDGSAEAADSVTVQLLKNGQLVKTAVLNAQNGWQMTFADMPESDAYRIQEVNIPQGFTATYSQDGYVFTVTNTATLIQTGQRVWPIPVLGAGGVLLIAVGVALLQKKRETHDA